MSRVCQHLNAKIKEYTIREIRFVKRDKIMKKLIYFVLSTGLVARSMSTVERLYYEEILINEEDQREKSGKINEIY